METITIILGLVMLVFGILQIILFFKVWGMTNDVSAIREILQPHKTEVKTSTATQKQEPCVLLNSIWRCPECDTINHYKSNGEAICEKCGYDLHR
jgi:membrane protease subunit (stomatin/prohibitin family)